MGELRDGVADRVVEGALRLLAAVEMDDRDARERRRHGGGHRLEPVAGEHERVRRIRAQVRRRSAASAAAAWASAGGSAPVVEPAQLGVGLEAVLADAVDGVGRSGPRGACRRPAGARSKARVLRGWRHTWTAGSPSPAGRWSGPRCVAGGRPGYPMSSGGESPDRARAPPDRARADDLPGVSRRAADRSRAGGRDIGAADRRPAGRDRAPSEGCGARPRRSPLPPRSAPSRRPQRGLDGPDRRRPSPRTPRARATPRGPGPGRSRSRVRCFSIKLGAERDGRDAAARCPGEWSDQPAGTPKARAHAPIARRLASAGRRRVARDAVEQRDRHVAGRRDHVERVGDLEHVRHPRGDEQRPALARQVREERDVRELAGADLEGGHVEAVEEVRRRLVERTGKEDEAAVTGVRLELAPRPRPAGRAARAARAGRRRSRRRRAGTRPWPRRRRRAAPDRTSGT